MRHHWNQRQHVHSLYYCQKENRCDQKKNNGVSVNLPMNRKWHNHPTPWDNYGTRPNWVLMANMPAWRQRRREGCHHWHIELGPWHWSFLTWWASLVQTLVLVSCWGGHAEPQAWGRLIKEVSSFSVLCPKACERKLNRFSHSTINCFR